MKWSLLFLALAACGGQIQGDDAGTTSDGGTELDAFTKKDAPAQIDAGGPSCTPIQGSTSVSSNGQCGTSANWSCGNTKYEVDCDCPSAQCSCSSFSANGSGGTTLTVPSLCPGCAGDLPTICGFPQ